MAPKASSHSLKDLKEPELPETSCERLEAGYEEPKTGYETLKTGCGEPIRISEGPETSSEEPETACKGPDDCVRFQNCSKGSEPGSKWP